MERMAGKLMATATKGGGDLTTPADMHRLLAPEGPAGKSTAREPSLVRKATEAKTGHIDKNEVFGGLSKAEEALLTALLEKKKRTNLGEGSLSSSVGVDTL